ncbi:Two-component transcriptional response regulator, LuxR family [hydrothermal vent metagenome]|uniref:Two-component transcriptional response regulator, LuxR family n=1 Tax=hydrothermal vent metagenome TaxID=652676 RepID=A0A3B0Z348_9ZZZZ
MTTADNEELLSPKNNIAVRVLLIDDQRIIAEAFRRMVMDDAEIEMHYCSDPSRALIEVQSFRPTVILQDLVMPDVDGLSLLKQFQKDKEARSIPVIVLTTKEDPKIKSEAFAMGASDYLVKFPDKIEVIARLKAHSRSYLAQQQRDAAYKDLTQLKAELERKNRELEVLSCRDALTGILNRRGFDNYLSKEWYRAIREKKNLGLLIIDVDFFKPFNDNYGHQQGDLCLQQIAVALEAGLKRASDVVARYGGEEFSVVLPNTNMEGALLIAETVREFVEALLIKHEYSKVSDVVTVSIGVMCLQPVADDALESLIARADKALYHAKHSGRNRCCTYQPELEKCSS